MNATKILFIYFFTEEHCTVLLRLLSLKQLFPEQRQLLAAADFLLEAGVRQVLQMTCRQSRAHCHLRDEGGASTVNCPITVIDELQVLSSRGAKAVAGLHYTLLVSVFLRLSQSGSDESDVGASSDRHDTGESTADIRP